MNSAKILRLINLPTLPKSIEKLLDEPITILKGAEEQDFQVLQKAGLKKVKDLVQIEQLEQLQQKINPITLEKLVTSARIIENIAKTKVDGLGKKIVIAGLDAAGKTTIIQTLLDPNYKPGDEKPTRGANTTKWDLFGFTINLWDLGGQSVYRTEYLKEQNSERHFGFTNLFIFVIDIQEAKRYKEAYDYLNRIIEIFKYLEEEPYCLILLHKSDPKLNPKDVKKWTEEISVQIKKSLVGFRMSVHNTSIFERQSLFHAFSKGLREISMVKSIISGIMGSYQEKIHASYLGLYDKTGICIGETGEVDNLLKTFTINVLLSEELGLFPAEANKLILSLKSGGFCIIERIGEKDRFYLAWKGGENPEFLVCPALITEMEPFLLNFLD